MSDDEASVVVLVTKARRYCSPGFKLVGTVMGAAEEASGAAAKVAQQRTSQVKLPFY
jgi:hypothetical protein